MKYRFKYRDNGTVIEVDPWDVPEMVSNSHDWEALDDVTDVMLNREGPAIVEHVVVHRGPGRPRKAA